MYCGEGTEQLSHYLSVMESAPAWAEEETGLLFEKDGLVQDSAVMNPPPRSIQGKDTGMGGIPIPGRFEFASRGERSVPIAAPEAACGKTARDREAVTAGPIQFRVPGHGRFGLVFCSLEENNESYKDQLFS